jgi:hypothetical protein
MLHNLNIYRTDGPLLFLGKIEGGVNISGVAVLCSGNRDSVN